MGRYLKAVLILSLLVAPVRGQTGPRVTESNVAGGGGVSAQGSLRLEGAVGQASAGPSSGGTFGLHGGFFAPPQGPSVQSVVRASANPATQNSTVGYVVTFNEPVTGVDATDFQLTTSNLTGASVTGVSGTGATYNVSVDAGTLSSASATLRLDLVDDDTILNTGNVPLGGVGSGNGNYTSGEVYTVIIIHVRANDAAAAEPASGSGQMLFTVTLDSPAPAGGISVNYATAGGGSNPATGGASCGGTVDYETASGTVAFNSGEAVKTFTVGVCADASGAEPSETFLVNLSSPTGGATVSRGQATGTITQGAAPGTLVISELRTSGPAGHLDDFVELYNNTADAITVPQGGFGLFKMGADCAAAPVLVGTVPAGTVIPARGHYLLTGEDYSLSNYGGAEAAVGDGLLTSDIENDRNLALFSTADVALVSTAGRLDAVGFGTNSGQVCDLLREGNTLAAMSGSTLEYTFFRDACGKGGSVNAFGGCPTGGGYEVDANNNATDFVFADTTGAPTTAGQRLGAPGPQNLASPVVMNVDVPMLLLDQSQCPTCPPNRLRVTGPDGTNTNGTISLRRRVVNNTGGPVTRIRFRVIDVTTYPAPGVADVRMRTSSDLPSVSVINDAGTCGGPNSCTVAVKGTTVETPPNQPLGGGFNATWSVTLSGPLAPGQSVNVQLLLGVMQGGNYRILVNTEALP